MQKGAVAGVVAVLAATLVACGGNAEKAEPSESASPSPSPTEEITKIDETAKACGSLTSIANNKADANAHEPIITIGDDGHTLLINTTSSPEKEYYDVIGCFLALLKTPEAITSQMDHTTALMGMQSAEDGDLGYQWSYHPDNGLNLIITEE